MINISDNIRVLPSNDCVDWCVSEYTNFIINQQLEGIILLIIGCIILVLPDIIKYLSHTIIDDELKNSFLNFNNYAVFIRMIGIIIVLSYVFVNVWLK